MTASDAQTPLKPRRSANHDRLVLAFLEHPRTEDAARVVGCSARTARRWKSDPANWNEVEVRRGEFLDDAVSKLRRALPKVADRLLGLALDEKSEPSIVVRAATACLEAHARLSTLGSLEERLAAIEAAVNAKLSPSRPFMKPSLLTPNHAA